MKKENWVKRAWGRTVSAFKRFWSWIKRAFSTKKELPTEGVESPSKLLREAFFRRKAAVVALVILLALFAFVFVAPAFVPMDINYTDPLQQNIAPVFDLRKVPSGLDGRVESIDGFSGFTAGLSRTGEAFVWGSTKDELYKTDLKNLPDEVKDEGAVFLATGKDHILAVTKGGKLIGWGDKSCGQYGYESVLNAISTPERFREGVEVDSVRQLTCGYQTSALVQTDGVAYLWGNLNAVKNLSEVNGKTGVKKVVFTNSVAVALTEDGALFAGDELPFTSAVSDRTGRQSSLQSYLTGRKAVVIASTNKCIAIVLENGETVVSGVFENGEDILPTLRDGEYFLSLDGGTRHFVGVTNLGNAYAWGHNAYGQCEVVADGNAYRAFAGAQQSYVIDGEGKILQSVGLKGYPMGTDGRGRDIFTRIAHGGKMTMTIGAVAVLVSSAIAIVVGCVSGYFGGATDTLLMRVTEIFSSIPFLPFAMLLSQIIKHYNISETARIFMIMLILGALSWPSLARIIRGQVLAEREKEFVTAAHAIGVKRGKIAFRHILPNIVSVILVSMTLDFAGCLLTESSLSYLGFGVQQPAPTWGNMLTGCNNSTVIQYYWWQWLFPALFLSLATVCINVIGDALRDALDPKSER
ncbi:MAG: ABC transporter permease subunit [Clostridia bacterium]|nr:ABC transporter permease subunit [Clostridia bacterium]